MSNPTPEPVAVEPIVLGYGHRDPLGRRVVRRIPRLRWRTFLLIALTALSVWWFIRVEPVWMPRLIERFDQGYGNAYSAGNAQLSPDKTQVAYELGNGLEVWDIVSGRRILAEPRIWPNNVAFSKDGRRLVVLTHSGVAQNSFYLFDTVGGRRIIGPVPCDCAIFRDDGNHLLVQGDHELTMLNTLDGSTDTEFAPIQFKAALWSVPTLTARGFNLQYRTYPLESF